MANLIITVISIALVAVAALMGAYYGGSAFMEGQEKAKVNRLVSAWEQTSAAVTLYKAETGNDLASQAPDQYAWRGFDDFLVPKYLSQAPFPNTSDNEIFSNFTLNQYISLRSGNSNDPNDGGGYFMSVGVGTDETNDGAKELLRVCKKISQLSRGENASPIAMTDYTLTNFGKFDCGWISDGSATSFDECAVNDAYCSITFAYRL